MLRPVADRKGALVFLTGVIAKGILIMVTPLSSDFIWFAYIFGGALPSGSIFQNTVLQGSTWLSLMNVLFRAWMIAPVDHPSLKEIFPGHRGYPTNFSEVFYFLSTPGSTLFLLITKSIFLFFDLALGFLIYAFVYRETTNKSMALISFTLWTLNPLSTFVGVLWGGVDLIMAFFLLLSVYLIKSGRMLSAGIAYGVSVATKLFPALLLPIFIVIVSREIKDRNHGSATRFWSKSSLTFILTALVTVTLMVLPTLVWGRVTSPLQVGQPNFPDYFFFYGPVLEVFNTKIGITPVFYVLFLFGLIGSSESTNLGSEDVVLAAFLVLFAFSHISPYYLLWMMPFLLISTSLRRRASVFILFTILMIAYSLFYADYYLATWRHSFLFYPVTSPELQNLSNALNSLSSQPLSLALQFDVLLGSLFAGFCLGYLALMLRQPTLPRRST